MSARIVVKKLGLDVCVKMHKAAARHVWRAAACFSRPPKKSAAYSTLASLFEGGVCAAPPRRRWEWTRGAENSLSLAYARQLPPRRAPKAMTAVAEKQKGTPAQPHGGEFAKLVFSCVSGRVPPRIRRCHAVDGAPLACKRSDATGCIISQACRFPFNKGATGLHAIALRSSGHVLRVPKWVWRGRGDFSTPRCVCGLRPMQQAYDAANDQKSIISPPLGWNCTLV